MPMPKPEKPEQLSIHGRLAKRMVKVSKPFTRVEDNQKLREELGDVSANDLPALAGKARREREE